MTMMLRELIELQTENDFLFRSIPDGIEQFDKRAQYTGALSMLVLLGNVFGGDFIANVKDTVTAEQFLEALY